MKSKTTRIIINADDLGISKEVNDAIFDLMAEGKITSATVLANGSAVEDAASRIADFPDCSFGAHLCLTEFRPLSSDSRLAPLLDEHGRFRHRSVWNVKPDADLKHAVFGEWMAQINRLRELDVPLSHVDSHHHSHRVTWLFPVMRELTRVSAIARVRQAITFLGQSEQLPPSRTLKAWAYRWAIRYRTVAATTDHFGSFDDFLTRLDDKALTGRTLELMVHPGAGPPFTHEPELLRSNWQAKCESPVELIPYHAL